MALKRIVLRDFVIIRELELELATGFTVLTGETGAGKSILVDALQLVTGARADTGVIREGAARAEVSAEFEHTPALQAVLDQAGFEAGDSLLLRRTVDAQGKSRAWVNGSPATAQQLRSLGELLIDIHGQHAWQSLTRPDAVRGLLDAYAQLSGATLSGLWAAWRQAQSQLAQALQAQDSLQHERERLAWQIGELDKLAPQPDEWAELNTQHSRLANGQALMDAARATVELLQDSDDSTLQRLHSALQALQNQAHLEPEFADPLALLGSSVAQLEDVAHTLRGYARRTELDPERLAELDARMTLWVSLARRYKRPPNELPALLDGWRSSTPPPTYTAGRPPRAKPKPRSCRKPNGSRPSAARRHRAWRWPSPRPCRVWACRAASLSWHWSRWPSRSRAGWKRCSFWSPVTPAARRGRWARWHPVVSCRAWRWPLPSPPASWARRRH